MASSTERSSDRSSEQNATPVRVVVDAMGGDFGPVEIVKGAVQALESENIELILVGDAEEVNTQLAPS